MDFTASYEGVVPAVVRDRFVLREVRNAAAVLAATNPVEFREAMGILAEFALTYEGITGAGGNKSVVAAGLDDAFRNHGWREGRHDTRITSVLRIQPYRAAGEQRERVVETEVVSEGYKVDNVKGRVALDVEWNAKDGNLDRDVGAYRALYSAGIIDGGILVVRDFDSIRDLSARFGGTKFASTTTTTMTKLAPRLSRGDGGGCPLLCLGITARSFDESTVPDPVERDTGVPRGFYPE